MWVRDCRCAIISPMKQPAYPRHVRPSPAWLGHSPTSHSSSCGEVFQTLFKPQDDRSGKLAPKITTTTLPDDVVGTPYKQTLQATGGTAPLKWGVNPPLPEPLE